jgi:hypothetical protein
MVKAIVPCFGIAQKNFVTEYGEVIPLRSETEFEGLTNYLRAIQMACYRYGITEIVFCGGATLRLEDGFPVDQLPELLEITEAETTRDLFLSLYEGHEVPPTCEVYTSSTNLIQNLGGGWRWLNCPREVIVFSDKVREFRYKILTNFLLIGLVKKVTIVSLKREDTHPNSKSVKQQLAILAKELFSGTFWKAFHRLRR